MDTKILVLLLLGASLLVFGCAGKKTEPPPTFGDGASPEANDTTDDEAEDDGVMDEDATGEDDAMGDGDEADENDSVNASGKDLSDLADLFKVETDKPLEDEGFDVKSVDSNKS